MDAFLITACKHLVAKHRYLCTRAQIIKALVTTGASVVGGDVWNRLFGDVGRGRIALLVTGHEFVPTGKEVLQMSARIPVVGALGQTRFELRAAGGGGGEGHGDDSEQCEPDLHLFRMKRQRRCGEPMTGGQCINRFAHRVFNLIGGLRPLRCWGADISLIFFEVSRQMGS